jgi:hypothetical protein
MEILQQFTRTFVNFSFLSMDPFVQQLPAFLEVDYPLSARQKLYNDYKAYYDSIQNLGNTAINPNRRLRQNSRNYKISVSQAGISVSGLQKPTSYKIVAPNGQIISRGTAENGALINSQLTSSGVYIFMLMTENGKPIRQKFIKGKHR